MTCHSQTWTNAEQPEPVRVSFLKHQPIVIALAMAATMALDGGTVPWPRRF